MRPRRTSEFLDETGTAAVSSTRSTRSTLLGTRHSFDRGPGSVLSASRGPALSANRGATPLRSSTSRCALFGTATNSNGALHNDKKWVQEQTQRITEHLKRAALMGHNNVDFINQTSLRQMSIKQFVSTINYFLQFMAGSRLNVGQNHVEDIVSVLQKLQYPYAVNKSWLKTPNTQHSFGNVIVLFSYMMDFVPPPSTDDQDEWLFTLEESPDNLTEQALMGWDPDFQQQMMHHCAEAFSLWDKQLMDEYADMQQQTCNLFIKKRTGLSNITALERTIEKLNNEFETYRLKCKPVAKEQIQRQQQLQEECGKLNASKQKLVATLESMQQEQQQLEQDHHANSEEILNLQQQIQDMKQQIEKQICTVQQREILVNQLYQLKVMFESEKRTMQTVQDQNYRQQIKLSRSKQQFTVEIEQFNSRMRKINETVQESKVAKGNCLVAISNGELQLPLNMKPKQLQFVMELLKVLNKQIAQKLNELQMEINDLLKRLETNEIQIKEIETDYGLKSSKLALLRIASKHQQERMLNELKNLNEYYQQLQVQIDQHKLTFTQINEDNIRKQQDIKSLQQKHENKLKETEEKHEKCMTALDEFYKRDEDKLNENFKELTQLHQLLLQLDN